MMALLPLDHMPESCNKCQLAIYDFHNSLCCIGMYGRRCEAQFSGRPSWCPLITDEEFAGRCCNTCVFSIEDRENFEGKEELRYVCSCEASEHPYGYIKLMERCDKWQIKR